MAQYIVELTEAEDKALKHIAISAQEWIDNVVKNRCRQAIDEIFKVEVERISEAGGTISGTKEDIVLAADIKTLAEMEEEYLASQMSE